jgi:hypothetical protein
VATAADEAAEARGAGRLGRGAGEVDAARRLATERWAIVSGLGREGVEEATDGGRGRRRRVRQRRVCGAREASETGTGQTGDGSDREDPTEAAGAPGGTTGTEDRVDGRKKVR